MQPHLNGVKPLPKENSILIRPDIRLLLRHPPESMPVVAKRIGALKLNLHFRLEGHLQHIAIFCCKGADDDPPNRGTLAVLYKGNAVNRGRLTGFANAALHPTSRRFRAEV